MNVRYNEINVPQTGHFVGKIGFYEQLDVLVICVDFGYCCFFTGEIVTFIMLGFILIALININTTLKKLVKKDDE